MTVCNVARARLLLLGAFALACTNADRGLPLAPSFSLGGDPMLTGAVLGPDGSSICNFLPTGSVVRVRPIDPAAGAFAAPANLVAHVVLQDERRAEELGPRPVGAAAAERGAESRRRVVHER